METIEVKLKKRLGEVFYIDPNDLGIKNLTRTYKTLTQYLKTIPLVFIIPSSFVIVLILYLLVGNLIVRLASLLQYGF